MYNYQFICYIFKQIIKIIIFYTKTNYFLFLYGFNKLYSEIQFILIFVQFQELGIKKPQIRLSNLGLI